MNKLFLNALLLVSSCFIANAENAVVTFNSYKYAGDVTNITDVTDSDFAMGKSFTIEGLGSFVVTADDGSNTSQVKVASNPHLQFAINNTLTITPENATITNVVFYCTTKAYTREVTASEGTAVVDSSNNTISWSGSVFDSLSFDNNVEDAPIRIMYFDVTYTTEGSSAIETISSDTNTEARYYNLIGTEVASPEKGGIYIMRIGNESRKVIVK